MLHVITNNRVYTTLKKEIDAEQTTSRVTLNSQAQSMPYLQAVIKEGLRIWQPLASLESKEVAPDGDTYNGVFLPGGINVGLSIWGVMRRTDIWGDDAEEFKPERWLETNTPPEKLKAMQSTLDFVFHVGKWQCMGKDVALIELNKLFPEASSCDH
jgi:cytochrome P450